MNVFGNLEAISELGNEGKQIDDMHLPTGK